MGSLFRCGVECYICVRGISKYLIMYTYVYIAEKKSVEIYLILYSHLTKYSKAKKQVIRNEK